MGLRRERPVRANRSLRITQYSFCTNGSHYAGEAGIPTIGFGPSREDFAHTIDESIEIDQLLQAARGYFGILQALFQKDEPVCEL
jgi:acetylornithine deacetylase/succinyl-diaminopimelate desuccinylase-like protein